VNYKMVSKILVQQLGLYGPRTSVNFEKITIIVLTMMNWRETVKY
jgi:hypothetical protein